ncbi:MAG: ATP-binding cassette domain-containing protein [Elusimicrobiota bacterium]|jgi:sulfonate transport system ATP-binding protein|nr:ATP-binding cassette domain-containing protein [Elusimicrobiota bacterium]
MPIALKNVSKVYYIEDKQINAVNGISAVFAAGKISAIVGKSGCGKTTILKLIAGLERLSGGSVDIGGQKVGIAFQENRLFPWLDIKQNLGFSSSDITDEQIDSMLKLLEIWDFRNAYPEQISGGMAQRAALGRVLLYNPDIVLLDEPFSFLDYFTRKALQAVLAKLQKNLKKTILLVTHDLNEALSLADDIYMMKEGFFTGKINFQNGETQREKYTEQILNLIS